jgi:ABC-type phosphate/phosphonate transport system substrate-binding protein
MRNAIIIIVFFIFYLFLGQPGMVEAQQSVKFGVLANKGAQEAFQKWKPLTEYLKAKTGKNIELVPFATSNPAIFIAFREKYGVYPIATTAKKGISTMGGAILVKKDSPVNSLGQLRDKKISIVSYSSLGGYVVQAYTLKKNGIDISREAQLKPFSNQDHVVFSVLNGAADAGFVRTNQLESMARKGMININDLKIINKQEQKNFPFLLSTDLIPEWPIFATQRLDKGFVKALEQAILSLSSNSAEAQAAGISGFIPPGDYEIMAEALKVLGMEPFKR